eukprot:TRINITY_DN4569_c0_g1_i1.p4 TRINITY_DN4569_c0_g1~~TRINITY_DN4569_c0_g1_i1.p4  ORF type:complete len:129 (-),score=40.99 TRINITY_DN4569_c0_g1_i1:475-861(-)
MGLPPPRHWRRRPVLAPCPPHRPPCGGAPPRSGMGAGTAAGSSGGGAPSASPGSPNFGAIYKLFAGLFDPQRPFDAGAAVEGVGILSALDKEIVKLLVKNLEVNLGNVGVCRRLLQNYMASVNAPVGR